MSGKPGDRVVSAERVADALSRDGRVASVDCSRGQAMIGGPDGITVFSWGPGRSLLKDMIVRLYGPGSPDGGESAYDGQDDTAVLQAAEDTAGAA